MIRPATPADAPALAALWNPWITDTVVTFSATPKTATNLQDLILNRPVFLTTDSLQGFATYTQFRGGDGYVTCMEHSLILAPTARGQGLGRALLLAIEQHAAAHGAHQMIAGITAENPAAVAFHACMGYAHTARIRDAGYKFGRFIDLLLMQKFLS